MRLRRPWSWSSLLGRGILCAGLATLACQAEAAHDLDRALGLDGDRVLTHPPPSSELDWTDLRTGFAGRDTLLLQPRSLCFLRDRLLVADGAGPRIEWFDLDGEHHRTLGRAGEAPGEFRGLGSLRCREDGAAFMAVDAPQHRIQWFDSAGRHLRSIPTPPIPAGFPYQGEFALAQDGHWVDSWLAVPVGPVLDHESDWEGVALARIWDGEGTLVSEAGRPVPYADPTLRRILNQVSPEFVGDTLWLLTHASATLAAYDLQGQRLGDPVALPLYHRGIDPVVMVESVRGAPVVASRAAYQPNLTGLAALEGGRFAVLRYRDWRDVRRHTEQGESRDFWPRSFVEVVDRSGRVLSSHPLPGRARVLASDRRHRVAVIVEHEDTEARTVLMAELPLLDVIPPSHPSRAR